jgi:hypothetical protein
MQTKIKSMIRTPLCAKTKIKSKAEFGNFPLVQMEVIPILDLPKRADSLFFSLIC